MKQLVLVWMILGLIASGCADLKDAPGAVKTIITTPTPVVLNGKQSPAGKLLWGDEFNGPLSTPPGQTKWTANVGGKGWGNEQLEYDTDNLNAYQDGQGNLVLEARRNTDKQFQCWYGTCQYTSARISTSGHFSFMYGRLEARIKIPYGQGIWPAFWLLGSNVTKVGWPASGEIDVMENNGHGPALMYGSAHSPKRLFTYSYTLPQGNLSDDFHTFALQWDADHLYFFVDNVSYASLDRTAMKNPQDWGFDHPFNIVLNTAVGGKWPGKPDATTAFPQKMYVSYVRLYSV